MRKDVSTARFPRPSLESEEASVGLPKPTAEVPRDGHADTRPCMPVAERDLNAANLGISECRISVKYLMPVVPICITRICSTRRADIDTRAGFT